MRQSMEYAFIVGYLVSCVLSWLIFVDDYRKVFDVKTGDAILFALLSVGGPLSIVVASIGWLIGLSVDIEDKQKTVWRKK